MAQATTTPDRTSQVDDPAYVSAWQAVRNAHQAVVERIEIALSEASLPPLAWYDVLVKLDSSAAPVRPKDMLCQVSVTKSGLTRLLDRIEKAGLVERSFCSSDRRGTFLSITKAGRETLAEMKPIRDGVFREHFVESLSPEEADQISEMLGRVAGSAVGHLEDHGDCEV
ncbi:MAG TPA: MarR family transcriptional regulator [Solirubrobacterales bacterium]|nr:MarR family transcriptional regulator [Solirubrobacterales bacterium]